VEGGEHLCTVGGIVNHHYPILWKTVWRILRTLKMELLYDLTILLLEIHPKEMKTLTQKDICTPMFIAALFTITKTWKQPRCPCMDELLKL